MKKIDGTIINEVSDNKRYIAITNTNDIKILDYNQSYGYFNLKGLYWCDGYSSYIELIEYLFATHTVIEFENTIEMERYLYANFGINFKPISK